MLHPLIKQNKAIIFDMDGLLIDSEPYWKIAEKEVFGELGLDLSDELLRKVMGFRLSEVVAYWFHYQPWPNPNQIETEQKVLTRVKELIIEHAKPLPGVYELIQFLEEAKIPMAIASSSAMSLIEVVVKKLEIEKNIQLLWSAEYEPYGKPHPGIFLTTAKKLGVEPQHCLVFEDSINGVIAAKAAKMKCIAVPEAATYHDPRFAIADKKISKLTALF